MQVSITTMHGYEDMAQQENKKGIIKKQQEIFNLNYEGKAGGGGSSLITRIMWSQYWAPRE